MVLILQKSGNSDVVVHFMLGVWFIRGSCEYFKSSLTAIAPLYQLL
jgi:hypothetical protein